MIWMTKMENMVMNLAHCNRQVANNVVNAIVDECDNEHNDAMKKFITELKAILYDEWSSYSLCKYIVATINEIAKAKGINLED